MNIYIKNITLVILLLLGPVFLGAQTMDQIMKNKEYVKDAKSKRDSHIKREYHTDIEPFMLSMSVSSDGESHTVYTTDTITYSTSYLPNGMIEEEKDTLPRRRIYDWKRFYFNDANNLIKTIEIDSERIRFYEYQRTDYKYGGRRLLEIDKVRAKHYDTVRTTTLFKYNTDELDTVIERNNANGDTLLTSYFSYNYKKGYVEERCFYIDFCQVRTVCRYRLKDTSLIKNYEDPEFKKAIKEQNKLSRKYKRKHRYKESKDSIPDYKFGDFKIDYYKE